MQFEITDKPANTSDKVPTTGNGTESSIDEIESIIGLIKKGDAASLAEARMMLGVTSGELAKLMGVTENTLSSWELEAEIPPHQNLLVWRIKLGNFLEDKISRYLRTTDPELIHQFWDVMWRLNDLGEK